MDDKAYTCFYCHSILPYDVCISGTHFCLQATNAIEFWGNVVKIASANSVEEQDGENDENGVSAEHTFKQEVDNDENRVEHQQDLDGNEDTTVFSEMETESASPEKNQNKSMEDSLLDSQDVETDSVKPMNWRLKMIALVKQRPPLYDKRLPLTERTFPIRAKLWKEVYDGLNGLVPIDLLPKRFKVLRDRYNKELKRRKLGHSPRKPWSLFKYLDFLSHAKKKICIRKMSLANGDCKVDEFNEKLSLDKLISSGSDKLSVVDEDTYKENLETKKKFVQLVGERPPLYDCRLPRPARVAENKVKLWREVYEALQGAIPLVDLPRKFKSLRDRYMKEKKKSNSNEPLSSWPLMEYMTYLDDVAYIRSSQENHINNNSIVLAEQADAPTKMTEEKKLNELPTEPLESMTDESLSPLRNIPLSVQSPARDDINIIVPDDIDNHRDVEEDSETLLVFNQKEKDGTLGMALKNGMPASPDHSKGIKSIQEMIGSCKLKKLDPLETYNNWTEDDFFGAYLVKLMQKLPLEERLRLHIDIINMIRQSLKNV